MKPCMVIIGSHMRFLYLSIPRRLLSQRFPAFTARFNTTMSIKTIAVLDESELKDGQM